MESLIQRALYTDIYGTQENTKLPAGATQLNQILLEVKGLRIELEI